MDIELKGQRLLVLGLGRLLYQVLMTTQVSEQKEGKVWSVVVFEIF